MKQLRIAFTVMFMMVFGAAAFAQWVSPVDFMRNNPRAAYANPATYTSEHGYFDLALGGINIGVQNLGLKYNQFFRFDDYGYPIVVDLNQGVNSLLKNNYINSNVGFDVFNCGRRTRYGFFTYSHRIRMVESFRYSKDLLALACQGNGNYVGKDHPAKLDVAVGARAWQEFNAGYQMCLTDKLNIGARVKFLIGAIDARSSNLSSTLITDPDTYALTLTGGLEARATLPYEVEYVDGHIRLKDGRFNVVNWFKNYGFGIDLGAEYQITDEFGVGAAINDLGWIRWNHFSVKAVGELKDGGSLYHDGSIIFAGLTPDQVEGIIDNPDYLGQFVDSLKQYFDISMQPLAGYTTGLNTSMMVRGYYDVTPSSRFVAQLAGYHNGLGMLPAFTLAYDGAFLDRFDVVASYTMMKGSLGNLGLGLSANLGGMLLYVASNNLLGFLDPIGTSNLNFQFGISFTGGPLMSRSERIVLE